MTACLGRGNPGTIEILHLLHNSLKIKFALAKYVWKFDISEAGSFSYICLQINLKVR